MRRWNILSSNRRSLPSNTAIYNLLDLPHNDQSALIHRVTRNKWLHQRHALWQQSRSYVERGLIISAFQQGSQRSWEPDLDSQDLSNETFQDLLSEAARYSIHDVRSLDFESSVTSSEGKSTRLVEHPKYQFDYELWAILLSYRMRAYGDTGIKTIWKSLTRRDRLRMLPDFWTKEDSLWNVFVSLGLRDHEFLERIKTHAQQLWRQRKIRRSSLYVEVVGGLLKSENPAAGPVFSASMHPGNSISSEELVEVFLQAGTSPHPKALEHFCLICDSVPNHKIYGKVISTLCEQEQVVEAMAMHNYLFRRRDFPRTFEEIEPLIRRIPREDLSSSGFIRQMEEVGLSFSGRVQRLYDSLKTTSLGFSRESIDLATNMTFGTRRSKISDAFAARVFATKSFTFDFAVNGLHMLGLEELGPLSLRQIALQAHTAPIIRQRLAKVDSLGIDTGGSAYSRVVRKLANTQQDTLLMDIISCDQHPDVFEDPHTLSQLLTMYHDSKDWRQVNRTLAILGDFRDGNHNAPNALLRSALMRKVWVEVVKIATQMHQRRLCISRANLLLMYQFFLRPRRTTKRVSLRRHGFQDLLFLMNLWQTSLIHGANLPPDAWREPLRRLGMMGRLMDLEKACLWLSSFYFSQGAASATHNSGGDLTVLPLRRADWKGREVSAIDKIFTPALQRGIVEWGFIAGLGGLKFPNQAFQLANSRARHEAPWVCGLELLCHLQRHFGVRLHVFTIKAACRHRLRQLFSYGGRSKLRFNREARAKNTASLHFYLDWINEVYGQVLLEVCDVRNFRRIFVKRPARLRDKRMLWRSMSKPTTAKRKTASSHGIVNEDDTSVHEDDFVMYRDFFNASWEEYLPKFRRDKD